MCLTIPAKVIKINKNEVIIQDKTSTKKISAYLISNLKPGDWLLYINDLAVKKISARDAKEILYLLESQFPVNLLKLSKKFQNIITHSRGGNLTKSEIIYLLKTKGQEKQALFQEANTIRQAYLRDFICIHGIIEFSNFCQNNCAYCGLCRQNRSLKRYRMPISEIVKTAVSAVNKKGYKLLVLQSGEDYFYTDEMLAEIIKKIKAQCRVFIIMSVGERGYNCYKKMKQAGASGALFRFETSNPHLFEKLHPPSRVNPPVSRHEANKNLKNRLKHLKFMKELGYFIATGSIIGSPGQTLKDLTNDILVIQKYTHMVSMGPYVPAENTPLKNPQFLISNFQTNLKSNPPANGQNSKIINYAPQERAELNLKMIAILRLLMPEGRIPVVTALETLLGEEGRKKALMAGANSLMLNLTPAKYRPLYKLYNNKFFKKRDQWEKYGLFKAEESWQMLKKRMKREIKRPKP